MSSGEDVKSLQQKLREMEKGQEDLQSKVAKKERDCEMKEQEKVRTSLFIIGSLCPISMWIQGLPNFSNIMLLYVHLSGWASRDSYQDEG